MAQINPNNPPPALNTWDYWQWVESNILAIKRRLNGISGSGGGGGGTNIYNSDGTLTGNRTLDTGNNSLSFVNGATALVNIANVFSSTYPLTIINNPSSYYTALSTIDNTALFELSNVGGVYTNNMVAGVSQIQLIGGGNDYYTVILQGQTNILLDTVSATYSIGDVNNASNGTKIVIDDMTSTTSITGSLNMNHNKVANVKDPTDVQDAVTINYIDNQKGVANGLASLDATGLVPLSQLPIGSALINKGAWNASTNTPTLADGSGTNGDFYVVSVGATRNLGSGNITFVAGNGVLYNGTIWQQIGAVMTATVTSVSSADNTWLTVANGTTTPVLTVVSAPKLATARTINGVAFDGTANILLDQAINTISDAAYTLVLTDDQKLIKAPFTTGRNVTVPPNSSVAFPIGTQIDLIQYGAGAVTFAPGSGVTIRSRGSLLTTNGQYTGVTLKKIGTNEWILMGNLT